MSTLKIEQLLILALRFYYGIQYLRHLSLRISVTFLRIVFFLPLVKNQISKKIKYAKITKIFS